MSSLYPLNAIKPKRTKKNLSPLFRMINRMEEAGIKNQNQKLPGTRINPYDELKVYSIFYSQ
jgi:hypothetical protein